MKITATIRKSAGFSFLLECRALFINLKKTTLNRYTLVTLSTSTFTLIRGIAKRHFITFECLHFRIKIHGNMNGNTVWRFNLIEFRKRFKSSPVEFSSSKERRLGEKKEWFNYKLISHKLNSVPLQSSWTVQMKNECISTSSQGIFTKNCVL